MASTPLDAETRLGEPDGGDSGKMSFFDHLNELRKRIIYSAAAILLGAFVGFYIARRVLGFVARPMVKALTDAHLQDKLIFTHPAGFLNLTLTLGLYLGVALASPYVLYQIWLFIAPGLYKHEKKAVAAFIGPSVLLFFTGIAFAYYVILPYLLKFLVTYSTQGNSPFTPLISAEDYFDLVLIVMLGVGVVFETPMLIYVLSLFGIVTPKFLLKNFRYAILIIAIVAAIITPTPDAMTMLVFMGPMILLYVVGIGVSWFVLRSKLRAQIANARKP
jgi:sec-independent protein translocase protein TatC